MALCFTFQRLLKKGWRRDTLEQQNWVLELSSPRSRRKLVSFHKSLMMSLFHSPRFRLHSLSLSLFLFLPHSTQDTRCLSPTSSPRYRCHERQFRRYYYRGSLEAGRGWLEKNRVFTLSRSYLRTAEKLVPWELRVCKSTRLASGERSYQGKRF